MIILEKFKFRKLIAIFTILPVIAVLPLLFSTPAYAANKTAIAIDFNYQVDQNGILKTVNTTKYTNNTPNTVLTFSTDGKFTLDAMRKYSSEKLMWDNLDQELKSLKIKINNTNRTFTSVKTSSGYEITYKQNVSIKYNEVLTVTIEFTNPELIEKVGKIYNIYIPESPVIDNNLRSRYEVSITTNASVSKSLGPIHFATEEYRESNNNYVFSFQSINSSKKTHVIQIGDSQVWKFELTQKVDTVGLSAPNLSEYKVMIPGDDPSLNQKVYFEDFSPKPQKIESLPNGDLQATYYLDQNVKNISVKGYLIQSEDNNIGNTSAGNLDLSKYLLPEQYWEVDNPLIVASAKGIANGKDTMETIMNTYDFVISKVDYDNLKLGINNVRQGAVQTLKTGSGVCMEYSDLLITLLRAKGIPSRAVFGYGYTPGENGANTEKHQWVQAYIDGTGWVSIDPTWGNTTRKFIGKDFDHFSWFVSEENVESPKEVTMLISGNLSENLDTPNIYITPVDENVLVSKLFDSVSVMDTYKLTSFDEFVYETRVIIYFPYILGVLVVSIVSSILFRIFRNITNPKSRELSSEI
ncbi:MAG: transglutaminase-like domain-containing protein [bacterium]